MDDDTNAPITDSQLEGSEAITREGATPETTTEEVGKLYEDLGIKAPVPTGKAKGRPKAADVRDKDDAKKDDEDTSSDGKKAADSKKQSKDAPADDKDGSAGNGADPKGKEDKSEDGKVPEPAKDAGDGVRKGEPKPEGDAKPGGEGGSDDGDAGASPKADDSKGTPSSDEEDEGKRPGKSNPGVEKRFQKLTNDVRERDEVIQKLQQQLQENQQKQEEAKIAAEDPEFKVEDFRTVQDRQGNVLELTEDEAELAYRRWKDGYDQRAAERQAKVNQAQALEKAQQEYEDKQLKDSVEAYDTLVDILDNYPALNPQSNEFDGEFSALVMPAIEEMVIYQEGTEPGNEEGKQPVILGLKMNPKTLLDIIKKVQDAKRTLPLNGVNDTVEKKSNLQVNHSRNTDPTVQAANELYQELGINKRIK